MTGVETTLALPRRRSRAPQPAVAPLPARIGPYEIRGLLGEGAMGRVYRAYDAKARREVAVKTLKHPFSTDTRALLRLKREANVVGLFSHPALVPIHDVGPDYIVQELVEGETLLARLGRSGPLAPSLALPLLTTIADALDHVHKRGVVHRDVKPANVLLMRDGRVKLTDFGVAHLPWAPLTRSHELVGSPAYMAPEQISRGEVDARSDLHALAVLAFETLTGIHPFLSASVGRLLESIVRDPPPRASRANRRLPPAVDDVFAVAFAKDPNRRHSTGRVFVRKLESSLGTPASLRGLWAWITARD